MATPYPLAGASIALAGADKLFGDRGYQHMFSHLGWTKAQARKVGAAEVLGGLLMAPKPTRRLGAAIVIAASASVLAAELKQGEVKLAASRGGVLLAALGALFLPG
jgi:hypothetical protein